MANRVEMISPASPGTVLVQAALVGQFKAQGWKLVAAPVVETAVAEDAPRKPGRPKKK